MAHTAGHPWLDAAALGAVGFLVYGPQFLVGVCAADRVSKKMVATATGCTGLSGYMGSVASGAATGWVVDRFGWGGGFSLFIACALLGCACFLVERRLRSPTDEKPKKLPPPDEK